MSLPKVSAFALVFLVIALVSCSFASAATGVERYIPDESGAEAGMTLWQVIRAGGEVMIVLALLSIAALGLVIYYFITMKEDKLLPEDFLREVGDLIEEGKFEEAGSFCSANSNLISDVVLSGIERRGHEKVMIKEAIEDEGRRSVDDLRQKLSYLADVAAISPMVGLLGTVLGMIQAFNVIAFQTGAVKPILLASGISKAMVTTAAGLIIAIPAMIFYSYFRGRLQDLVARLESISAEMFHLISSKN